MLKILMEPTDFFSTLEDRFNLPLPGESAQNRMTARPRVSIENSINENPKHKISAVFLPLFHKNGTIYSALIKRPAYDGLHSGQLALPGGKWEVEDVSLEHTAIRETMEEVGIPLSSRNILGKLTPLYIPVSNFVVHPFVGKLNEIPKWIPDQHEVESVLEFPISNLFDPALKDRRGINIGTNSFIDAPCYIINGQILWGATAMIFSELEILIGSI